MPRTFTLLLPLLCSLAALLSIDAPAMLAQSRPLILPAGFVQETLAEQLGPATAFAIAPDGRIFIARKHGSVKILRDGQLLPGLFIDLSSTTNHHADRGLMGIALHPDFPHPAYVYLAYTYEPDEARGHAPGGARVGRVLRVEADPANLDRHLPGSEVVILGANGDFTTMGDPDHGDQPPFSCTAGSGSPIADCLPVDGPSHIVNGLAFGPDGALYVSTGDATLRPDLNIRAQDIDSLAGKILRIDPITGQGYNDNPFFDGDPNSNRSKVYALGLRNPFRFTFEPQTGRVVVGDVGGERWEEINRGGPGANFGWPCYEGPDRLNPHPACADLHNGQQPITPAWHSYPHRDAYSAAIGGAFYAATDFPTPYHGAYFFADHNRAALLVLLRNADGGISQHDFATNATALVQVSAGPDGTLYVLSFIDGALSRIRYVGGDNAPPLASATAQPTSGLPPLQVIFSSAGSADPQGGALSYRWVFGDGAESADANPIHSYTTLGQYVARLTVTDATGVSATASAIVLVGDTAPVVRIVAPADQRVWPVGSLIQVRGEAVDAEDGLLNGAGLRWDAVLHHNEHIHLDYFHAQGSTASFTFEPHGVNVYLELCLTATDTAGLEGRACVNLQQENGQTLPGPATPVIGDAHWGRILRERWTGIGGSSVADLIHHARYPQDPNMTDYPSVLDSAQTGKDYGERLRGYLHPPTDGDYRFWIASDDSSELWLSSDADAANARLIAAVTTWTGRQQWEQLPGQASALIPLQAGKRYYIEIRHKQADQKDNLSVAWQIPGQAQIVIDGTYLAPFEP